MDDVVAYSGKRVVVVGAGSDVGLAVARRLIELGAEVHMAAERRPDVLGWASFTECDPTDADQVDRAVEKVGRYLDAAFHCALPVDPVEAGRLVDRFTAVVTPTLLPGGGLEFATVDSDPDVADRLVNRRS